MAADGYRVLAFAYREFDERPAHLTAETVECELDFLGLVALFDPPREGVATSVALCQSAGITPVMITGDHPGTARALAARLGIAPAGADVLTGADLLELAPERLRELVNSVRVYARVSPEQKIDIVRALQASGEFVAMTGDGVNDAPALKGAEIGVAMGRSGTEVAREAADMVLLDDDFSAIVTAAREGRRVFDNIRKFIKYTMTSNSGEIWTLLLAPFFGLPIPLLPIQILWINLVTDGLPGLALAVEPEERGLMQRPPRAPDESIFAHGMGTHIFFIGLLIAALSIGGQAWAYAADSENWRSVVFTVLTLCQLAHVLVIRSERESIFSIGLLSNKPLLAAVILTVLLQLAVVYTPFLQRIFETSALSARELALCFSLPAAVLVAVELEKFFVRRADDRPPMARVWQNGTWVGHYSSLADRLSGTASFALLIRERDGGPTGWHANCSSMDRHAACSRL
jgi:Ca2+-transporting ATPase